MQANKAWTNNLSKSSTLAHFCVHFLHFFTRGFFVFFYVLIQHYFICRQSDSTVSENAGIEPRTVATSALALRRPNHSARSHPQLGQISSILILYFCSMGSQLFSRWRIFCWLNHSTVFHTVSCFYITPWLQCFWQLQFMSRPMSQSDPSRHSLVLFWHLWAFIVNRKFKLNN